MYSTAYRWPIVLILASWCASVSLAEVSRAEVDFNRDVRPLLSAHCFKCHGPDADQRQADLRLDVPGAADLEEVLRRIGSADPDERMPPPESNKPLTPEKIRTLGQWVDSGAHYAPHWSFVKPRPVAIRPDKHPVDACIDAKLSEQGIAPAGEADAYTLVRRVTLDMIGLPPTLAEADAFAADPSDAAYLAVVDRLLASPQYGERWARRWLDLARYADTNGYEKDRDRQIWPYRDWVIRAINADIGFDQFTVEQIAGDMLSRATPEQWVATGFHRNTMLNEEGGIDPLEFRFHAMTDRVATTGTTWLGLTVGCAQCHTHKFDPITHRDYYGMMAYLNNTDETDYVVRDAAKTESHEKNLAEAESLIAKLPEHWPGGAAACDAAFAQWLQVERDRVVEWKTLQPTTVSANVPYLVHEGDGVIFAGGDTSKHDIYRLGFAAAEMPVAAIRLEALPDKRLPDGGPGMTFYEGRKGDFFLTELTIAGATVSNASESYAKNHFNDRPVSARLASDGDIQSGWSVAGRIGARHVAVFVLEEPHPSGQPINVEMHFGRHFASSLGKFRLSATSAAGAQASDRTAKIDRLLVLPAGDLQASQRAVLKRAFVLQAPEVAEHAERIAKLQVRPSDTQTLVMRERPADHPRPTFLHHRGEYQQPTAEVSPRLPDALLAPDQDAPQDRLEFARWLVSDDNPLTARVVANRQWAALFGNGIVTTLGDFGMQGAPPTHPRLLDHLALFLIHNDWSIKKLHRHIVTSAVYRRASRFDDSAEASRSHDESSADLLARLLARFPRQRLEAEIIRDSALQAAGILHREMFGPPVRPLQPEGVTEVAYGGPKWTASTGPQRYRRSIYTYQKRTAPFAMFTTFDAGSGESCLARRDRSNTPLQALTLLNDPMFVDIAEAFGKDLAATDDDVDNTITTAFRRVLTRFPTDHERERLRDFHRQHASWPALARALLCLDEAVIKE